MDNQSSEVEVSVKDKVCVLRFNRPKKKNAVNFQHYQKIEEELKKASGDPEVSIVVFTGTGNYFTSGNEFSLEALKQNDTTGPQEELSLEKLQEYSKTSFQRFISALIDFPKPLIAVLNGSAVGMGVTMLGLCDVVYASDKATLHTPFVNLGLGPEGCSSYLFPRIMGQGRAAEMLMFGKKLTAAEGQLCGLVTEVFPEEMLNGEVWRRIYKWAQLPPNTMKSIKSLMASYKKDFLHEVNALECNSFFKQFKSEEFQNAMMQILMRKSSRL